MTLSLSRDQMPISKVRERLAHIVDELHSGARPAVSVIKDGTSKAVILATEEYEALAARREEVVDSLEALLGLRAGLDDLSAGRVVDGEEARRRLLEARR